MSLTDFRLNDWRGHMTGSATEEFSAFIGLDWADAKHDICLQVAGSDKQEVQVLEHKQVRKESNLRKNMDTIQTFFLR